MNAPVVWPGPPAGCTPNPCFDAASLLQCYCDIQATTQLISTIVQNLLKTDPAFVQAFVDAIAASGSNLPLIGVTNGADAQSGQVGEFVLMQQSGVPYINGNATGAVTMGVLQPGDWDCWGTCFMTTDIESVSFYMNPTPAGFSGAVGATDAFTTGQVNMFPTSTIERGLISVPSLIVYSWGIVASLAGTANFQFMARRRR